MAEASYEFEQLSTRDGFNRSLRHFKTVNEMVEDFEEQENLADLLDDYLSDEEITADQVVPILNALLVDRYDYHVVTHNLQRGATDFKGIAAATKKWKATDLVICYFHTELGPTPINPKSLESWSSVESLKRNELVTVYAGGFGAEVKPEVLQQAAKTLIGLLEGKSGGKPPAALTKGSFTHRERAPREQASAPAAAAPAFMAAAATGGAPASTATKPAAPGKDFSYPKQDLGGPGGGSGGGGGGGAPSAKKKMTPMYSIPVTNELFHNGNVEAWKKIIQSYATKYETSEVYVFYDGEKINDLNTLFKWGKVKHGSAILISVAGDEIKDVAKLQRYLKQGASPMFEAFLKFPPGTVLNLF